MYLGWSAARLRRSARWLRYGIIDGLAGIGLRPSVRPSCLYRHISSLTTEHPMPPNKHVTVTVPTAVFDEVFWAPPPYSHIGSSPNFYSRTFNRELLIANFYSRTFHRELFIANFSSRTFHRENRHNTPHHHTAMVCCHDNQAGCHVGDLKRLCHPHQIRLSHESNNNFL